MEINFDKQADALYIQFQPGKVKETVKLRDGILFDIGRNGKIFGIEILDASSKISLKELGHLDIHFPIST